MKNKILRDSKGRFVKGMFPPSKGKHIQTNSGRTHFKKGQHPSVKTEIKKGQHFSRKTEFKKGHKESKEVRVKRINSLKKSAPRGENHPNWTGGTSFEGHGPDFNDKFKRIIRKRDNHICMVCGKHQEKLSRTLSVHHIDYNKQLSIPQNCITLCSKCHGLTNFNRESWVKFFQALLKKEFAYDYLQEEIVIDLK